MLNEDMEALVEEFVNGRSGGKVAVKRGEEIFANTDYPQDWAGIVGQEVAKRQLQVQIASAKARGTRIEHTLLASGVAGVGKTTLATLTAYQAGVGLVQTTGPLTVQDARKMMSAMEDGDILFVDEAHRLTEGGRNKADWLLPFMLEGVLYTERGAVEVPDVALVAATTDVGKLPLTLISRFMCQPKLTYYTAAEAAAIAENLAGRMQVTGLPEHFYEEIATAASRNPRTMRRILTTLRDLQYATPGVPDLGLALEWCGLSRDGLETVAQDMMLLLLAAKDHTASAESLQAQLNEPGPLRHVEQSLLQRGFLTITGRGRQLTDAGRARAIELVMERRL